MQKLLRGAHPGVGRLLHAERPADFVHYVLLRHGEGSPHRLFARASPRGSNPRPRHRRRGRGSSRGALRPRAGALRCRDFALLALLSRGLPVVLIRARPSVDGGTRVGRLIGRASAGVPRSATPSPGDRGPRPAAREVGRGNRDSLQRPPIERSAWCAAQRLDGGQYLRRRPALIPTFRLPGRRGAEVTWS
jgi:hypothetical protein